MDETKQSVCPLCENSFKNIEIDTHVSECILLNSEVSQCKKRTQNQPKDIPKRTKTSNLSCERSSENSSRKTTECIENLPQLFQPKNLEDFHGQEHVRTLLESGNIISMILWGPPGCGKTSLSSIISELCVSRKNKYKFISLHATSCETKQVENELLKAKNEFKSGVKTVFFIDEIHAFNKKQQNIFLECLQSGEIILIGATTENPSFCVNSTLLRYCKLIVMEKLPLQTVTAILENTGHEIDSSVIQWLAETSDGDARVALTNLELLLKYSRESNETISVDRIKNTIKRHVLYDRNGEEHHQTISAMHDSMRASHTNAGLYWLTRMLVGGEKHSYIARRMIRAASEDIGNVNTKALQLAITTMQAVSYVGEEESDNILAQYAIYFSKSQKCRAIYRALEETKRVISACKGPQPKVPLHLRPLPPKIIKKLGHQNLGFLPSELHGINFLNRKITI